MKLFNTHKTKKQRKEIKRIRLKNKKILKTYPFLSPIDWFTCTQLSKKHPHYYDSTVLDDIPRGWKKAFGLQLAYDIKKELKEKHIKDYYIFQVKEKFGALRWYDNYSLDCLKKYEKLSEETCCVCGKHATMISTGWICPYCTDCANNLGGRFINIDTEEIIDYG